MSGGAQLIIWVLGKCTVAISANKGVHGRTNIGLALGIGV